MRIEKLQSLPEEVLNELLVVWEKSARSSHHFLKECDIAYFKKLIKNQYLLEVELFAIRNESGRIAAFMGLSEDMLEMLFVLPEEQGRGYGKALVEYAVGKRNICKVDVNEDNKRACGFYLHMGYEVIGRDDADSFGKSFPILHLRRPPQTGLGK